MTAGVTYYIVAAGQDATMGAYTLQLAATATTTDTKGMISGVAAQILAGATTITGVTPIVMNSNATSQNTGTIDFLGDDDIYSFAAPMNGTVAFRTTPTSGGLQTVTSVYGGSVVTDSKGNPVLDSNGNPTLPLLASGTGDVQVNVTGGDTYYVMAAGNGQTAGNYMLMSYYSSYQTFLGIHDPRIIGLVEQDLARDGEITREDMIQILQVTVSTSSLSAEDFADLQTIINQANAGALKMPSYVEVLANDIVNGSPANAYFTDGASQPTALGDLQAGSLPLQMDRLIGKWFEGTDLPTAEDGGWFDTATPILFSYNSFSGSLYGSANGSSAPALTGAQQGDLGDCYFIATLAGIANVNPTAIENMFLANGDGTWTVRFYNNGVADYVTVNDELPVLPQSVQFTNTFSVPAGAPAYNGVWTISQASSSSNVLWLSLAEKAYAQWNEVGAEDHGFGNDGINAYQPIAGGFSQPVMDQVLGTNDQSQTYYAASDATGGFTNAQEQAVIKALATPNEVVTGGTIEGSNADFTPDNLIVEGHEYTITGYNASTGMFTVHNPWGNAPPEDGNATQPPPLTWAEMNSDFDMFSVATTANTQPIPATNSVSTQETTTTKASTPSLPKLYATTGGAGTTSSASAAAGAWFAQNGSQTSTKQDPPPATVHDLALLAYLG